MDEMVVRKEYCVGWWRGFVMFDICLRVLVL